MDIPFPPGVIYRRPNPTSHTKSVCTQPCPRTQPHTLMTGYHARATGCPRVLHFCHAMLAIHTTQQCLGRRQISHSAQHCGLPPCVVLVSPPIYLSLARRVQRPSRGSCSAGRGRSHIDCPAERLQSGSPYSCMLCRSLIWLSVCPSITASEERNPFPAGWTKNDPPRSGLLLPQRCHMT
jgi:hypothetical protein